jgi:hypothetical protein
MKLFWLCLGVLLWGFPSLALAQSQQPSVGAEASVRPQSPGSISGTVLDSTGAALSGARVTLTHDDSAANREAVIGEDGQFTFDNVAPGPFRLTVAADNFAVQSFSGNLDPGQAYVSPQIALRLASQSTEVKVVLPHTELAAEELKEEEKQRILGFIPNFYVSYIPDAVPLTPRQKFQLAWKTTLDPVNITLAGAIAGVEQAADTFSEYGQGAQGYGKRYGALYADIVTGTFIGDAVFASLLKQDPRYFYKGSGSTRSRIMYAISNAVICKSDSGHWQPAYSEILGSIAAGGISNLYYPARGRNGAQLAVQYALFRIAASVGTNLLQEFLIRKLTPKLPNHPSKSQTEN